MAMYRRVLAIVTRSFYHTTRHRHPKSIKKPPHKAPRAPLVHSHVHLASSSSRLTQHSHRKYASSPESTTTTAKSPSIVAEAVRSRQGRNSSFRRGLVWIAAVTSLSYIGYKYYFYDDGNTETEPSSSQQPQPSIKRAVFATAQELIENALLQPNNINRTFKVGVWLDRRKRYREAMYFYKLYLRDAPTKQGELAALNNLIVAYYRLDEFENALTALQLIGKQQITERNLEFIRAHCHHTLLEYDLAIIWYMRYLSNPSSQTDIAATYNNIALLFYECGNYHGAYEYFNKLGEETIREKGYLFRVAHCLQYMNEFDQSLAYYNAYLEDATSHDATSGSADDGNVENTYHNLAVLFYDQKRDGEAMQMFEKLGETEVTKRDLEFKMAHCYARGGDNENAIKYLRRCMAKPEIYGEYSVICHGIIAQIYHQTGDYEAAKAEFDALGESEIAKQDLCFAAAYTYFKCGEYESALKYYDELLNTNKLSAHEAAFVHCRMALVHYKMSDYAQCLAIMKDRVSAQQISEWNMEFIMAHSHHKLRQYAMARDYYLSFLGNEGSDAADILNCHHNLALLCFDLKEYSQCCHYFELMGGDAILSARKLEYYVAYAYQQMGRSKWESAIKYYQLYLQREDISRADEVYYNLGHIYYAQDAFADAVRIWNRISNLSTRGHGDVAAKLNECYDKLGGDGDEDGMRQLGFKSRDAFIAQRIEMAKMYYDLWRNDEAMQLFASDEITDADICKHDAEFVAAHCFQLGGDEANAIKYYKLGLQNNEKLSPRDLDNAYLNLGCAYHDASDYANAIECFERLTAQHITQNNLEFIIAVSYHNCNQNEAALRYYESFCANPLSASDKEGILSCYNNMILLYLTESDPDLDCVESAWNLLRKMNEAQITQKQLELETAHCALKLTHVNDEVALKYYQLFLQNTPKEELHHNNHELLHNIYNNCAEIKTYQNVFHKFENNNENEASSTQNDDDDKLQLFLKWILKKQFDAIIVAQTTK